LLEEEPIDGRLVTASLVMFDGIFEEKLFCRK